MTGRPTLSAGATRQAMVSSNSREWSGMLKDSGVHFSEVSRCVGVYFFICHLITAAHQPRSENKDAGVNVCQAEAVCVLYRSTQKICSGRLIASCPVKTITCSDC